MRVLYVNGREDSQENPGGDTIQMLKTKTALESMGVDIQEQSVHELDHLRDFDIAHVFNIQMPNSAFSAFQKIQEYNIPIALSSIFWDMFAHWFEMASKGPIKWRLLNRLLGKSRTREIYINWQQRKAPGNTEWQTQQCLLAQANRVLPNSFSEANLLQKTFQLNADFLQKVDVIPNGIDPSLYLTQPEPSSAFAEKYGVRDFVLQVGTIHPVKNQIGLIQALHNPTVPIVFIGKVQAEWSDYAKHCKALASERGNVIFIDRLPHEELPGVYALAAVHALPSWRETPGLVSLEAGAAGCKVVSTSIGSTYDYFKDLAWYCYPDDNNSIRNAVENALQAPRTTALRDRVLSKYTWQQAAETTMAAYIKALN